MEEEVTPKTNTPIKAPIPKQLPNPSIKELAPKTNTPTKAPIYKNIEKEPFGQSIKTAIPNNLIPTKRLATILGFIFLAVIIFSVTQIPYGEILQGSLEIKVGYPLTFLEFGEDTIRTSPLIPLNLIIDLVIYLILAYIIEVLLSFILSLRKTKTRQKEGIGPKIYEPTKPAQ